MKIENRKKIFVKLIKIIGFSVVGIVALLTFAATFLTKDINGKVTYWAHKNLKGELAFKDLNLSFFNHFPYLTVTLYQVDLKGATPFENQTLIKANEIALGIDIKSVFGDKININKVYLDHATVNIQTDSLGHSNYQIFKTTSETENKSDIASTAIGIEMIKIVNSRFIYNDASLLVSIDARGFDYTGKGDLTSAVFDLATHAEIDSLDFTYDHQQYLKNKKINADLVTQINTNSLAFVFQKNDLKINNFPLTFIGMFAFLKSGYDLDFSVDSKNSKLEDLISAIPADYSKYFEDTKIKGDCSLSMSLKGQYVVEENKLPTIEAAITVANGFVEHKDAPFPIKNLALTVRAKVPNLNPQELELAIAKSYFNVEQDYFDGTLNLKGIDPCVVSTKIKSQLNLESLSKALNIPEFAIKGLINMDLSADGKYATAIKKTGIRKVDTLISSIPKFNLKGGLKNGYFKYTKLPAALENVSFDLNAVNKDSNYKNTSVAIENINVNLLNNYLKGYFKLDDLNKYTINSALNASFKLEDIAKFYPLESMAIKGDLKIDAVAKGTYEPKRKIFPVTVTEFALKNGYFKSADYPIPLNNIDILTRVTSSKGSYKDLKIEILPLSFKVAQEPFMLKANLEDFNNLRYDIKSKGYVDLAQIYKIFGIPGYDLAGKIRTNLALKGKQSDATNGQYQKLDNKGSLEVNEIALSSDLFPKPFIIKTGKFSFFKEKMLFKNFSANYGKSTFSLEGSLLNVINYFANASKSLSGDFSMKSDNLDVNEFMVYASTTNSAQSTSVPTGVVLIPDYLDFNINASVKNIKYDDLSIKDFKGNAQTKGGKLYLKENSFDIIGTKVSMEASYAPINLKKADFTYNIKADSFDIQRAYKEIALFREMASSAKDVYGLVSLNYQIGGRLDDNMSPIMSSLVGNGALSLNNIKFKNFKLMNQIAAKTSNEDLKDGKPAEVTIKTSIKNNIMKIERTRMKMAGFRLRFEGETSLDGKMNIGFRLGLPPLGIIGVPIKITGTSENPVIEMGRQSNNDKLEETTEQ